jgi:hypothetical protein
MGVWDLSERKAQSALEYLITYGWAILLIVLVITVLFKLGAFSPNTFTARVQPGSCVVSRPYGPNTTKFISLEGVCTSGLPEYMPLFNDPTQQVAINAPLLDGNTFSISTWIYWFPGTNFGGSTNFGYLWGGKTGAGTYNQIAVYNDNGNWKVLYGAGIGEQWGTSNVFGGTWYNVVLTWNKTTGNTIMYVNGVGLPSFHYAGDLVVAPPIYIGGAENTWQQSASGEMNGYVSDVQFYNTVLTQGDIQTLYSEGPGGVPINLYNLTAWYPLNGNAQDYSGNGNNGKLISDSGYSSQWINGYTPT